MGFWIPQVIDRVGNNLTDTSVGLLTAATYILGAITLVWWGAHSDKKLERRYHLIIPLALAAISLCVIGAVSSPVLAVIMLALIVASVYAMFGPFWALPPMYLSGPSAVVGIAMINCFGNLAGFVSPSMIGIVGQATGNLMAGFYVIAVIMVVAMILVAVTVHDKKLREDRINVEAAEAETKEQ
jgi:ACS family tartrate transporter-like MFS transporter